jgi:hypothetical protein
VGLGTTEGYFAQGPNNQNDEVLLDAWTPNGPGITGFLLWE